MKKTFLLLAFFFFCLIPGTVLAEHGTIPARQKVRVTPQNVEQLKKQTIAAPSRDVVWTVSHSDLIDWETLRPEIYDEVYARISGEFFLSQFSLKRRFRLEPFFPLLFPKTPGALRSAAPEIREKVTEVRLAVNQTLHEIHTEYFLLPLMIWCKENQVPLEYEMRPEAYVPAAFLIEDAQVVRRLCVENGKSPENGGFAEALANSSARQNGRLDLEGRPLVYSKDGTVLLIPDQAVCGEVEKFQGDFDFLAEFQIRYATVTLGKNGPEAGVGAASWKTIQLMQPRERYSQETRIFLKRFEDFGGKVVK